MKAYDLYPTNSWKEISKAIKDAPSGTVLSFAPGEYDTSMPDSFTPKQQDVLVVLVLVGIAILFAGVAHFRRAK